MGPPKDPTTFYSLNAIWTGTNLLVFLGSKWAKKGVHRFFGKKCLSFLTEIHEIEVEKNLEFTFILGQIEVPFCMSPSYTKGQVLNKKIENLLILTF